MRASDPGRAEMLARSRHQRWPARRHGPEQGVGARQRKGTRTREWVVAARAEWVAAVGGGRGQTTGRGVVVDCGWGVVEWRGWTGI